ncbi:hypothetical protein ACJJTC_008530 [Scirpophaga incertulas]
MRSCRSAGHRSRAPRDRRHRSSPLSTTIRSLARAVSRVLREITMDSSNNSSESCWPKLEDDSSSEYDGTQDSKMHWNTENTTKLIESLEKECQELWNVKHPLYRDRNSRHSKHEYLANMFGTTVDEVCRKIHNLRTQFNSELRKIKLRQTLSGSADGVAAGGSGWQYFDALSFLLRSPLGSDAFEPVDGVNLELAEFQANEEEEFGLVARSQMLLKNSPPKKTHKPRVAASAPPPLPPHAHPMMWPEEAVPRLRPSINADECQIFGDFVASELRMLRSDESRKRLKRVIQKAILQIGEEEDVNIITG